MSGLFPPFLPLLPLQLLADRIEVRPQEVLDVVVALLLLLPVASRVVHVVAGVAAVLVVTAPQREGLVVGGG